MPRWACGWGRLLPNKGGHRRLDGILPRIRGCLPGREVACSTKEKQVNFESSIVEICSQGSSYSAQLLAPQQVSAISTCFTDLCKYSGSDSVEYCLELTECCDGTDNSLAGPELDPETAPNPPYLLTPLLPPMNWLKGSENFSPRPLICKVSAVCVENNVVRVPSH